MTPLQAKYANHIRSMYCAFSEYHDKVSHTVQGVSMTFAACV
jgi:hypothetical protein